jgi:hypothetical protein
MLILIGAGTCFAQSLTRSRIDIKFTNEIDEDLNLYIGDCISEMGNSISYYNKGNAPYQGFSSICGLQGDISFHIEMYDEFTIHIPDLSTNNVVTYSGKRGVEKNNYVRNRQAYLRDLENRPDFLGSSPIGFKNKINSKKDSLLSIAKSLKLSDEFLEDEELFWEYYVESFLLFYESLKTGKSDITKADKNLFKPVSYYSREEQRSFPDYRRMVYAYYWPLIEKITSYDELYDLYKEADSDMTEFHILNIAKALVFNRHPNSEHYVKLIDKKHKYKSNHIKDNYQDVLKVNRGDTMIFPPMENLTGETVNIQSAENTTTFYFVYNISNARVLENNFLKWKKFYEHNKSEDYRFVTIGVDVSTFKDQLPRWFTDMDIPGTHLIVDGQYSQSLMDSFGLSLLPTVIETDSADKLMNWNIPIHLTQKKRGDGWLERIPWIVELGMKH